MKAGDGIRSRDLLLGKNTQPVLNGECRLVELQASLYAYSEDQKSERMLSLALVVNER